ncbi:flavin reductase family protein [Nocardiopsis halotolerans]|uniref:flavin reductase family protein n=1 Tax=Nocardiopsis halotolerans TaxID=124252 RepID=UPI00034DCDDE|nr:flavin reductase family protein [Nocardiopsis halotolerans]
MSVPRPSDPAVRGTVDASDLEDGQRVMMSHFPTGVSVVTSLDAAGRPHGMTCTSLTSVSLAPPTLLVCLGTDSRTMRAVREHGHFGVNLLHHRAKETALLFSGSVHDRFSRARWEGSPGAHVPWLVDDAFATAECAVRNVWTTGDHGIVVGEVGDVRFTEDTPLMYGMRRFLELPSPSTDAGPSGDGPVSARAGA